MRTLIRGGTLVEFEGSSVERADLLLDGSSIAARGAAIEEPADETFDASGCLVCPGLVVAHTHLYSALARGMPAPPVVPGNFPEILQHVWWVLDRALDLEMIRASGLVGALAAARCGVTALVDHHASPSCIDGSLAALRGALETVGLRGLLCYEVTERGTREQFEAGLAENAGADLFGVHAAFTLSDEGLARCGDQAERLGIPCHVHVAEDSCDLQGVDRLERAGVLRPGSVTAHLVHTDDAALARVEAAGCWQIHNARSNMNNHVGHARPSRFGERRALGTDGIDGDLLAEVKAAWFKACDAGDPLSPGDLLQMIAGGQRLAGGLLGLPLGRLAPGAPADLAILRYDPPTPLDAGNLAGHLIFGIDASQVVATRVGARWVWREGSYPGLDQAEILAGAREQARRLWSAMEALR